MYLFCLLQGIQQWKCTGLHQHLDLSQDYGFRLDVFVLYIRQAQHNSHWNLFRPIKEPAEQGRRSRFPLSFSIGKLIGKFRLIREQQGHRQIGRHFLEFE